MNSIGILIVLLVLIIIMGIIFFIVSLWTRWFQPVWDTITMPCEIVIRAFEACLHMLFENPTFRFFSHMLSRAIRHLNRPSERDQINDPLEQIKKTLILYDKIGGLWFQSSDGRYRKALIVGAFANSVLKWRIVISKEDTRISLRSQLLLLHPNASQRKKAQNEGYLLSHAMEVSDQKLSRVHSLCFYTRTMMHNDNDSYWKFNLNKTDEENAAVIRQCILVTTSIANDAIGLILTFIFPLLPDLIQT